MSKIISLTKGKSTIVDDGDYRHLMQWKWAYRKGYASRTKNYYKEDGKRSSYPISMQREILNPPVKMQVDHINNEKLDNRRLNLRICTPSQNCGNKPKCSIEKHSFYKGVSWNKRDKIWCSQIMINRKPKWLGTFPSQESAAKAYNEAAIKHFGDFARLNIIGEKNE